MHAQFIGRVRVAAAILALSLSPVAAAHAAPAPVTVKIDNFTFTPQVITIPAGTTVTWVNDDDAPHTVVADDHKSFRSKPLDTGESYSFTFMSAGTFPYFCSIHPHMTGKVVVKAS